LGHPHEDASEGPSAVGFEVELAFERVEDGLDGYWTCPLPQPTHPGTACDLQPNLTTDLNLIGGWPVDKREPLAHDR
jgi:hypothetical protein